jgi:predicted DNA binding CopG/RHH family protein
MTKALQIFDDQYLERCRKLSPDDIVKFLDEFRQLYGANASAQQTSKSKLISMKVPEDLLAAFKTKAQLSGLKYQTQIKVLMNQWLKNAC